MLYFQVFEFAEFINRNWKKKNQTGSLRGSYPGSIAQEMIDLHCVCFGNRGNKMSLI